jgi:hypothetical protein
LLVQDPTDEYLEAMMNEAPGPINFTMFLTLFGERLQVSTEFNLIEIFFNPSQASSQVNLHFYCVNIPIVLGR